MKLIYSLSLIFLISLSNNLYSRTNINKFNSDKIEKSTSLYKISLTNQIPDYSDSTLFYTSSKIKFYKLITPIPLILSGVFITYQKRLNKINSDIKQTAVTGIDDRNTIDDFLQFAPVAAVYALNFSGIRGRNNFRDRTIILGISYLIMGTVVHTIKTSTHIYRPDGSTRNSFPSGHTATAFVGAEFLMQEFENSNQIYGFMGIVLASMTGAYRINNNRHWFSDVLAGAGIGILSTRIAYWIYPYIKKNLFFIPSDKLISFYPVINNKNFGLNFSIFF